MRFSHWVMALGKVCFWSSEEWDRRLLRQVQRICSREERVKEKQLMLSGISVWVCTIVLGVRREAVTAGRVGVVAPRHSWRSVPQLSDSPETRQTR